MLDHALLSEQKLFKQDLPHIVYSQNAYNFFDYSLACVVTDTDIIGLGPRLRTLYVW